MVALLFGALISPTDSVSVLALFKKAGVPEYLRTLVESESLFNDATGVVLFTILLEAAAKGNGLSLPFAVWNSIVVSGAVCSLALDWAVLRFSFLASLKIISWKIPCVWSWPMVLSGRRKFFTIRAPLLPLQPACYSAINGSMDINIHFKDLQIKLV